MAVLETLNWTTHAEMALAGLGLDRIRLGKLMQKVVRALGLVDADPPARSLPDVSTVFVLAGSARPSRRCLEDAEARARPAWPARGHRRRSVATAADPVPAIVGP